MSTSLHAVSKVTYGNIYFVTPISNIHVRKCDFLQVIKIPYLKNRFLVNLEQYSQRIKFFPGRGWFFPVSKIKEEHFKEKMSSPAGLEKSYSNSRKNTDFGQF